MRLRALAGTGLALTIVLSPLLAGRADASQLLEELERELRMQLETVEHSLVTIVSVTRTTPLAGEDGAVKDAGNAAPRVTIRRALGCGVVLDSLGTILTTCSVVENADYVEIYTRDGTRTSATILGTDPWTDLALLRGKGSSWTGAPVGNSDLLRTGSWVTVMGNAFGSGPSVTTGVVRHRSVFPNLAGERLIQMNLRVRPGDTGGVVMNTRGEVVGIVCGALADSDEVSEAGDGGRLHTPGLPFGHEDGVSFAIPLATALRVAEKLRADGEVARGYLGVEIMDQRAGGKAVRASQDEDALEALQRVRVMNVQPGSPAEHGGLVKGDAIVEANGETVTSALALKALVLDSAPGSPLRLLVERGGDKVALTVEIGRLELPGGTHRALQATSAAPVASPSVADVRRARVERMHELEQELDDLRRSMREDDSR